MPNASASPTPVHRDESRPFIHLRVAPSKHASEANIAAFKAQLRADLEAAERWHEWRLSHMQQWERYLKTIYGARIHWPAYEPTFVWNIAPGTSTLTRHLGEPRGNLRLLVSPDHPLPCATAGLSRNCSISSSSSLPGTHRLPFVYSDSTVVGLAGYGFFVGAQARQLDAAHPDNSWMEVIRFERPEADPHDRAETIAETTLSSQIWYYHAPGSGIFLDTGRSLRVRNRHELVAELHRSIPAAGRDTLRLQPHILQRPGSLHNVTWYRLAGVLSLCEYVRHAGFDTVQICAAYAIQYEVVDCRDQAPNMESKERLVRSASRRPSGATPHPFPDPYLVTLKPTHATRARHARELAFNTTHASSRADEVLVVWPAACPPMAVQLSDPDTNESRATGGLSIAHALRLADTRPCVCSLEHPILNCEALSAVVEHKLAYRTVSVGMDP